MVVGQPHEHGVAANYTSAEGARAGGDTRCTARSARRFDPAHLRLAVNGRHDPLPYVVGQDGD